ncbi:MAG: tetratricopeptide repeat protein [Vitreimonas sp.]
MATDKQLREAMALHRQGRLSEAANAYRALLLTDARNADALQLLGVIELQLGQTQRGVDFISKALALRPDHAEALSNLAYGYRALRRPADALEACDRLIAIRPNSAEAHSNRGLALMDQGRNEAALESFDRAIALDPQHAGAHCNRGSVLHALKSLDAAVASLDRALAIQPSLVEAQLNRANVLLDLGRFGDALTDADQVLSAGQQDGRAHLARAYALLGLQRHMDAKGAFAASISALPNQALAHLGAGRARFALGSSAQALTCYERAIELDPGLVDAHIYRAYALLDMKRRDEALVSANEALALDGTSRLAHLCRANVCHELERKEEALADYRFAAGADHDLGVSQAYYLSDKLEFCDWADLKEITDRLIVSIGAGVPISHPFPVLTLVDDPHAHLQCAQHLAASVPVLTGISERISTVVGGKIRVGYFSSDFHNHPVSHLLRGTLAHHDRRRFEIFAFSSGRTRDAWSESVEDSVDHLIDVQHLSDSEVVTIARRAHLDIAVDLNGYTKFARTAAFAARLAPVQLAYLGYLGAMGAPFMDYIIADATLIPPEQRRHYSERVIYLPWYQCNDAAANAPGQAGTRADHGLPEDAFVFCSFNNSYKITPEMFDVWTRILNAAPESVLWLYARNATAERNLKSEALRRGVAPDRLIFAPRAPRDEHLGRQRHGDLLLDTFPYNGGATTSNALRAGLPVLTRIGDSFASRMGASLLTALGLEQMIARDAEAYETAAVVFASKPETLGAVRDRLADVMSSRLFNPALSAQHLERGFEAALARFRGGLPPDDIVV